MVVGEELKLELDAMVVVVLVGVTGLGELVALFAVQIRVLEGQGEPVVREEQQEQERGEQPEQQEQERGEQGEPAVREEQGEQRMPVAVAYYSDAVRMLPVVAANLQAGQVAGQQVSPEQVPAAELGLEQTEQEIVADQTHAFSLETKRVQNLPSFAHADTPARGNAT